MSDAALHTEVGLLPAIGYSSDTGVSLGLALAVTRLAPPHTPYAWQVSGQLGASIDPQAPAIVFLPEADPDGPQHTVICSRGSSTSMFFRLCSRAPLMTILSML